MLRSLYPVLGLLTAVMSLFRGPVTFGRHRARRFTIRGLSRWMRRSDF